MELTWKQKAFAIQSLVGWGKFALKLRDDSSWYTQHGIERVEKSVLSSGCESGETPEDAINQLWSWATDLNYHLVVGAFTSERKAVRWNGFMWENVKEEE